jgi:hypothetical protein
VRCRIQVHFRGEKPKTWSPNGRYELDADVARKALVATARSRAMMEASMEPETIGRQVTIVDCGNQYRLNVRIKTTGTMNDLISAWFDASNSPSSDWQDFYMRFPNKVVEYNFTSEIGEQMYGSTDGAKVHPQVLDEHRCTTEWHSVCAMSTRALTTSIRSKDGNYESQRTWTGMNC